MRAHRILLSARDPGASALMLSLAKTFALDERFQLDLVAQGAAIDLLRNGGFDPIPINLPPLERPEDPGRDALFEVVGRLIADLTPAAVVTGLSGPGLGVDEALVHLCPDRPVFSMQDFDGWVVQGFGKPASTYFVTSQHAADLTGRVSGITPVPVGDIRYGHLAGMNVPAMRGEGRALLRAPARVVTFYGQPAWRFYGYPETLAVLARAAQRTPELLFLYRPHPKETAEERDAVHALFDAAGVSLLRCPAPSIDVSLALTDLALSVFSTVGEDHVNLQRRSPVPIGVAAYLLFHPGIRALLAEDTGLDRPGVVARGLAEAAMHVEDVAGLLTRCVSPAAAESSWRRINAAPGSADAVGPRIAEHILESLVR